MNWRDGDDDPFNINIPTWLLMPLGALFILLVVGILVEILGWLA